MTIRSLLADDRSAAALNALAANTVSQGDESMSRDAVSSSAVSLASSTLRLTYFTARRDEPTTQVRVTSGTTAAGATPTLARIGLYLIDGSDGGTLVAATTNDTGLFAATNTPYIRPWATAYQKVQGQRYALGILVVTAATAPTVFGQTVLTAGEQAADPRLAAAITGAADLPATFTTASLTASPNRCRGVVLP